MNFCWRSGRGRSSVFVVISPFSFFFTSVIYMHTESSPVLLLASLWPWSSSSRSSSSIVSPKTESEVSSLRSGTPSPLNGTRPYTSYLIFFNHGSGRRGAAHHKRPFKKSSASLFIRRLFWEMYSQSAPPPSLSLLSATGRAFQCTAEDDGRINN